MTRPVECVVCDADICAPEEAVEVEDYGPAHSRCATDAAAEYWLQPQQEEN